jgi:hypothetical protein
VPIRTFLRRNSTTAMCSRRRVRGAPPNEALQQTKPAVTTHGAVFATELRRSTDSSPHGGGSHEGGNACRNRRTRYVA